MGRVQVYVPDELHRRMLEQGAEINWSEAFQEAMRAQLAAAASCSHPLARCIACGSVVPVERPEPA